jgi:hypothetical protein
VATTERPADGPTRLRDHDLGRPGFWRARSFALVTGALFLLAWSGQFIAQLVVERNEAAQHGQPFQMSDFWPQFLASTMENWQSEFLQLVWQAVGLALLLFWGSSQSREGEDRIEAKVDRLLEANGIDPDDVTRTFNEQV